MKDLSYAYMHILERRSKDYGIPGLYTTIVKAAGHCLEQVFSYHSVATPLAALGKEQEHACGQDTTISSC